MTTSSEEKIIRKRLVVEGDSGQDDRKITGLLKTFLRWCSADLSQEENDATFQKMLFTLNQIEFSFSKTEVVMQMNKRELERYTRLYSEIEAEITSTQERITELRKELKIAKEVRQHRQQYDAMAKVILQHPGRHQSHDQIQQLEQQLERLSSQHESLSHQLSLRRKQCHLLVFAIQQLTESLDQEQQQTDESSSDGDKTTPMET